MPVIDSLPLLATGMPLNESQLMLENLAIKVVTATRESRSSAICCDTFAFSHTIATTFRAFGNCPTHKRFMIPKHLSNEKLA